MFVSQKDVYQCHNGLIFIDIEARVSYALNGCQYIEVIPTNPAGLYIPLGLSLLHRLNHQPAFLVSAQLSLKCSSFSRSSVVKFMPFKLDAVSPTKNENVHTVLTDKSVLQSSTSYKNQAKSKISDACTPGKCLHIFFKFFMGVNDEMQNHS